MNHTKKVIAGSLAITGLCLSLGGMAQDMTTAVPMQQPAIGVRRVGAALAQRSFCGLAISLISSAKSPSRFSRLTWWPILNASADSYRKQKQPPS